MRALTKFRLIRDAMSHRMPPSKYFERRIKRWLWTECEWCTKHTEVDVIGHVVQRNCGSCEVDDKCKELREFGCCFDIGTFDSTFWKDFSDWVEVQIKWLE